MRIMKINRKNKGNKKSKPPKYTTENGNDKRNFTKKTRTGGRKEFKLHQINPHGQKK